MAICAPTLSAVAVTVESVVGLRGSQLSVLHTLNVRTWPESTGVTSAGARGGARSGRGTCAANSRSESRNRRSNCWATLGPKAAASGAPGAGGAASGLPPSLNACESSGMVVADCGTTRYSIVDPSRFAAKTAQPAVWVGSMTAYAPIPRDTCPPLVAVHGASGGWVPGLELQAAATSDDSPTIHRRFGIALFLHDFSGAQQRRAEADGSRHLVNPNHRHDQGLKGDPPFRERPPGELCEPQGHPGLRYKPEPTVPRHGGRHTRMPSRPQQAVAQAHEAKADEQQDPRPQIRQHPHPQPSTRQSEERHIHRQRSSFQLATQPLALGGREVLEIEPGRERDDQGLELHEPGHLRGDEGRHHQEQHRVPLHQTQVPAEREPQERSRGGRANELQDGRARNRDVQGAGAGERPAEDEHQGEEDGDRDVLHHRNAQQRTRHRSARVELAHHRHRDDGRRGRGQRAEHERHDHRVAHRLMPGEREPRANREQYERNDEEGKPDRAARDAREGQPTLAQRIEGELRTRGEPDQRHGTIADEPKGVDFLAPHQAEPRRPNGETDQQITRESRQPRAPRDFAADVCGEQEEAERQGRAGLERTARGHAMKEGHHQASANSVAIERMGRKISGDNPLLTMRWSADIFPQAVWRSFTSTRTASTLSSTAPTGSPTCSTGSRRWAWTRSPSPTTATCTGRGSSTPRPGRARSVPSSASRPTSRSGTGTSASVPLPTHRARIPISCCSPGAAPATSISSSSRPSDSSRAFTAGRASTGKCSSGTRVA